MNSGDDIVTFNLGFMLLPIEVNLIPEKSCCKRDALVACIIVYVKIIFALLTKIIALHIQASIIQFGVSGLRGSISG